MPKPMAICIEDVDAKSEETRFLRCVAVCGREPGLRVDATGKVLWRSDDKAACELWVSADERLILYRPEGAPPVRVSRAGRGLDVPFGKPVVVIDQDEVDVGAKRLRLHVHGEARTVAAPSFFAPEQGRSSGLIKAAAAAVALGSIVAGGCKVEVREHPPAPPLPPKEQPPTTTTVTQPPQTNKIQVRETPPEVVAPSPPKIEVRENPPDRAK